MKLLLIVAVLTAAATAAQYAHHGPAVLPDPKVTPGKVRTTDWKEVCEGGSTKQYRHTTEAEKNKVYAWYGAMKKAGVCCEVDHLVSLELGGADELPNLWPQPYEPRPGAHEKDAVENYLHKRVCKDQDVRLEDAQKAIAKDWYAVYLGMRSNVTWCPDSGCVPKGANH